MTIEITGVSIREGIVSIYATDISEENLQRMERLRDDSFERELTYVFDTRKEEKTFTYLYKYVRKQKCTRGCTTWGEALHSLVGIHTMAPSARYMALA